MTKIYTRTGDDGTTGLLGSQRVQKDALRVEAFGALDEWNAAIGMARSGMAEIDVDKILENVQSVALRIIWRNPLRAIWHTSASRLEHPNRACGWVPTSRRLSKLQVRL